MSNQKQWIFNRKRTVMDAVVETKAPISFEPTISVSEETRKLGEVLLAIADYEEETGRDGKIVISICCPNQNRGYKFGLGSGMEEHNETFVAIETLRKIHESVQAAKKANEAIEVIISAET